MRTRIIRAGMSISVACAALFAGAPPASALSGSGFIANSSADAQFVGHAGAEVYNTDTNNEHWVHGDLGVFGPVSGKKTRVTISGASLGESRSCTVYAMPIPFPGYVLKTEILVNPTTGPFTATTVISLPSWSQVTISCNLGRATTSQNSRLSDAYVTQSP